MKKKLDCINISRGFPIIVTKVAKKYIRINPSVFKLTHLKLSA